ncbi:MAG TPA: hypothetical protein VGQ08_12845 [Nitrospiraceae bacterium]|jgi:hypothetical protein|nr:hypothetical protein [Nitrospiraceae bacterium]
MAPRRRFLLGAVALDTVWAAESLAQERDRVPGPSPGLAQGGHLTADVLQ